jgi:hypothetical protein
MRLPHARKVSYLVVQFEKWLVVDTVSSEPFFGPNSPLTGKIEGNLPFLD